MSAWLNDAGRAEAEGEDLGAVLVDLFDQTGGPVTEQELTVARRRLASIELPRVWFSMPEL